jgi:hypothetical protein
MNTLKEENSIKNRNTSVNKREDIDLSFSKQNKYINSINYNSIKKIREKYKSKNIFINKDNESSSKKIRIKKYK